MRSLALVLPISLTLIANLQGQALTEHAAAAAGAAIGTGAGKSLSDSMTKIFGQADTVTGKAAAAKKPSKPVTNPAPDPLTAKSTPAIVAGGDAGPMPPLPTSSHAAAQPRRAPRKPVLTDETAAVVATDPVVTAPVLAEPIVKVPTVEDIASVKVGTTESDLLAALGQPSSRLTIPDDDGHLRETCQYWANGRALGTIRLDNGQVVTVETRPEN